ncbi:hypothetical protein [Selenomonas sp. KH1T6]|uniref:hypothetical protein n=1 Tax=Selenomonas sp. KH1T6 TaxID=3158784 RepID=UPI0008A7CEF5|nr:hypothetical protein SAMN05216583_1142 [Selenomonas ruminantium]
MKHMKLMFSLPVHEKPEVVLDTLCNLRAFHDDFGVVLHFSNRFDYMSRNISPKRFWEALKSFPDLYVNPKVFDTSWNGPGVNSLVNIHISNFEYLKELGIDFEYFVFMASNELYVKKGLYAFISKYDFGNNLRPILERPEWIQSYYAKKDAVLADLLKKIGGDEIFGAQIEGSFYKKEIFASIARTMTEYTGNKILGGYACEEIYYPTVCYHLFGNRNQYHDNTTYISWERNLLIEVDDVRRCAAQGNYFSVKRVNREFNDPVREYIRREVGKYGTSTSLCLPWSAVENRDIDESRYLLSDELLELEEKRKRGEADVYDALSYADRCDRVKDAEYLAELLLCDLWGAYKKALCHLAGLNLSNSFIKKLVVFETTDDIELEEEELLDWRKLLLLLRMLAGKKQLNEFAEVMHEINASNAFNLMLLEIFIRIESDDRLKFFSVKNGREVWMHYADERFEGDDRFALPEDLNGKKWPFAEKENDSPFAMYFMIVDGKVYYSIEFCVEDESLYENLTSLNNGCKIIDVMGFRILKFAEGIIPLDVEKNMGHAVNDVFDIFCDIGGKLCQCI